MPENSSKLKVLDLFSGILLEASVWALNGQEALKQSPFAKLKNFHAAYWQSIGRKFFAITMSQS